MTSSCLWGYGQHQIVWHHYNIYTVLHHHSVTMEKLRYSMVSFKKITSSVVWRHQVYDVTDNINLYDIIIIYYCFTSSLVWRYHLYHVICCMTSSVTWRFQLYDIINYSNNQISHLIITVLCRVSIFRNSFLEYA
jgi:hypothetical protein